MESLKKLASKYRPETTKQWIIGSCVGVAISTTVLMTVFCIRAKRISKTQRKPLPSTTELSKINGAYFTRPSDGKKMEYFSLNSGKGKQAIIIFHGSMGTGYCWTHWRQNKILPILQKNNVQLICPSMPGHGASEPMRLKDNKKLLDNISNDVLLAIEINSIMGNFCNCMTFKSDMIKEYRDEHMPFAKEMASNPRHLSNNDTFIPVNYLTGEYPKIYPQWLKNDISPRVYINIINKLNTLNESSLVFSEKRMVKYTKMSESKAKITIRKDKMELNKSMDKLLLEINNIILNPLGLNASSTLKNLNALPSEMGIIITHIHIHCNLVPKKAKSQTVSDDNLVILPIYEYEMTEINDAETY